MRVQSFSLSRNCELLQNFLAMPKGEGLTGTRGQGLLKQFVPRPPEPSSVLLTCPEKKDVGSAPTMSPSQAQHQEWGKEKTGMEKGNRGWRGSGLDLSPVGSETGKKFRALITSKLPPSPRHRPAAGLSCLLAQCTFWQCLKSKI